MVLVVVVQWMVTDATYLLQARQYILLLDSQHFNAAKYFPLPISLDNPLQSILLLIL